MLKNWKRKLSTMFGEVASGSRKCDDDVSNHDVEMDDIKQSSSDSDLEETERLSRERLTRAISDYGMIRCDDSLKRYKRNTQRFTSLALAGSVPPLATYRSPTNANSRQARLNSRQARLNSRLLDAVRARDHTFTEKYASLGGLLAKGASAQAMCSAEGASAVHCAAARNEPRVLLALLKHGADAHRHDSLGRTPLHLAACTGSQATLAILLDLPPELRNKTLAVPVDTRCELPTSVPSTSYDAVGPRHCIEHRCAIFLPHIPTLREGWTALHGAAWYARADSVRLLLAAGAALQATDALGRTPLDLVGGGCSAKVDISCFLKTIETLVEHGAQAGAELVDARGAVGALHAAARLDSMAAANLLLENGAKLRVNACGDMPTHECVRSQNNKMLKILLKKWPCKVDARGASGDTALHAAVRVTWLPGVCTVLRSGADVALQTSDGSTALHLAARKGNLEILNQVLDATKCENIINFETRDLESPLLCAIRSRNLNCVKTLVAAGASTFIKTYLIDASVKQHKSESDCLNLLLHAAAEVGDVPILQFLLEYDRNLASLLTCKHALHYNCELLPVEAAAIRDNFDNFKFLLHETFALLSESFDWEPLLITVAYLNSEDMLREIMNLRPRAVREATEAGSLFLHFAIKNSDENVIFLLIDGGADLSQCDKRDFSVFDVMMKHRPSATELLTALFDRYIQTNGLEVDDPLCEVTVDYRILAPDGLPNRQMQVLAALRRTGEHERTWAKLLAHPLVESFLELKWNDLRCSFYILVALNSLFASLLSVHLVSVFYCRDAGHPMPPVLNAVWWRIAVVFFAALACLQALPRMIRLCTCSVQKCSTSRLWKRLCLDLVPMVAALLAVVGTSIAEETGVAWGRHAATAALLLAWLHVTLLLASLPTVGNFIHMFRKVSLKAAKVLVTFLFLVLMFSCCFLVQFHATKPFESVPAALLKTFVMMNSEFDYRTFLDSQSPPLVPTFLFVCFVMLCAIVLMNFMTGVAVDDVHKLMRDGKIRALGGRVNFFNRMELAELNLLVYLQWFTTEGVKLSKRFDPSDPCDDTCYSPGVKRAILNIAQRHFEVAQEKDQSLQTTSKLTAIYQAVTQRPHSVDKKESRWNRVVQHVLRPKRETFDTQWEDVLNKLKERSTKQNDLPVRTSSVSKTRTVGNVAESIVITESDLDKKMEAVVQRFENRLDELLQALAKKTTINE